MINEEHKFIKYQHVTKLFLDDPEVDGLLDGTVHIQPKIDGMNAGMWYDGEKVRYAKRTQEMGDGDDCEGYKEHVMNDPRYLSFFEKYPNAYLFGEFLSKHTIKTYYPEAWHKFYVFDVCLFNEDGSPSRYLSMDEYVPMLRPFNIDYVPELEVIENPTKDQIIAVAENNHYLLPEDAVGEGVVCKNYEFINRYGRQTWGKYVRPTYKECKYAPTKTEDASIEQTIVDKYLTTEYLQKEYGKITAENNGAFTEKMIPQLLGTVEFEFISDNIRVILKKYRFPTIDFTEMKRLIDRKVKEFINI